MTKTCCGCSGASIDCCNSRLSRLFARYGAFVARRPIPFVVFPVVVTLLLAIGLVRMHFQTDMEILFTPVNGPGKEERAAMDALFPMDPSVEFSPSRQAHKVAYCEAVVSSKGKDDGGLMKAKRLDEILRFDTFVKDFLRNSSGMNYADICARDRNGTRCVPDVWLALSSLAGNTTAFARRPITFPTTQEGVFVGLTAGNLNSHPDGAIINDIEVIKLRYFLRMSPSDGRKLEEDFIKGVDEFRSADVAVVGFCGHSLEEEFTANGISIVPMFVIAFTAMIAFAVLTVMTTDWVQSKPLVGILGVVSTFLGIASAIGLLSAAGVEMSIVVGTMPMLLLGIGVDDMFIMVGAWRQTSPKDSVEKRMSQTLEHAAVSVTITSVTDFLAFLIGAITVFPSVQGFCLYTAIAVLFDYIYQITFFAGCLALDGRRENANRHTLTLQRVLPREVSREKGATYRLFCSGGVKYDGQFFCSNTTEHPAARFFRKYYGPLLANPLMKAFILLLFVAYLGVSILGVTKVHEGLELHHLVKDDSYAIDYFMKEDTYFSLYGPRVNVLFKEPMNYSDPLVQDQVLSFVRELDDTGYIQGNLTEFWLNDYLTFLKDRGHNPNTLSTRKFLRILKRHFLKKFPKYNQDVNFSADRNSIEASRFVVQTINMSTAKRKRGMMESFRLIASNWPVEAFVYSPHFVFYDQYPAVRPNTLQNIAIALGVMMIVAVLMIPHPLSACIIVLSIASIDVGVLGMMAYWHVDLDSITMVNLILCIGFSVDFSAHITHAFMTSEEKTRNGKMINALSKLGWPNVQSAASTILGILPLAFSASYVFRTFFKSLFLVIGLGFLHGVVLLPVVLSLIGPKQVYGKDASHSSNVESGENCPINDCMAQEKLLVSSKENGSQGKEELYGVVTKKYFDMPRETSV